MYSAEISRKNPSCILFLLDQSESMSDSVGDVRKDQYLERVFNRTLQEIILRCSKDGEIWDYFFVGAIGYGGQSASNALVTDRLLTPVSNIGNSPNRVDDVDRQVPDGAGGLVTITTKFGVWYEAKATGVTPMGSALRLAFDEVEKFTIEHPDCFPPVVLNITDGMATDEDPEPIADALTTLGTSDGNVLLFNLHVSNHATGLLAYPDDEDAVGNNPYARQLYRMSSRLPKPMQQVAKELGYSDLTDESKGYVFNAQLEHIVHFFEIGTRAVDLR